MEGLRVYGKRKKIPKIKIFGSATIKNVSGNVRTKSKIRDIRREVISVRNLNSFPVESEKVIPIRFNT